MDGDDNGIGETEFRITTRPKTLSKTLDQDGALGEKLLQLKNSRSGHLSTVTARKNEIEALGKRSSRKGEVYRILGCLRSF